MKILGIVTLYNPPKEVGENLSSYAPFLDGLYLWDNTAGGSNVDSLLPPEVAKRVLMHRRGRNVGIAMALNAAIDLALKEGYTHLLTMDQDSRFKEGTFQAYLRDVEADTDDKHWAFCPLINRDAQSRQPLKQLKGLIAQLFPDAHLLHLAQSALSPSHAVWLFAPRPPKGIGVEASALHLTDGRQ